MSTFQTSQTYSLSPILLSPTSTTLTNHISLFDNSDQGSVDSDYTSLGSSKFYGNSGSTSSLNRQGRSQSIDELATTTTIPTRHFNGVLHSHKTNNDPLQFVKIHPNHDLIERAQEQLSLVEARKRLQENYKLTNHSNRNKINDNEDTDWSKAVDSWRQKREQKRLKNHTENERPVSPLKIEQVIKPATPKQTINEPVRAVSSAPPVPPKPKSPSPLRNKGPSKIHEVSIEKPVDVRGFGFKLEDGRTQLRGIYISTIEDGSPADKAGLCIDDEVIAMNNENIENITFDQVRKILKERNLRGNIKLLVRTYEDVIDENSQTVIAGPTNDRSRTPSPQKTLSTTIPNIQVSPPTDTLKPTTSSTSLNIFTPKPFRSTASINIEPQISREPELTFSRKELLTLMSIYDKELQDLEAEFEKQLRGIDETHKQEATKTNEKQQIIIPSRPLIEPPPPPPPPTFSSVDSMIPTKLNINNNILKEQRNESPIAQVRSYVEKQMDQLQQDLEFGFSRGSKTPVTSFPIEQQPQQRPVPIPVDITKVSSPPSSPPQEIIRSSLKKSSSTQNELNQIPSNRTYGLKINPNEKVIHYLDPYSQQKSTLTYPKYSIPDLPSSSSATTHTVERTFNELKIQMPMSYSSQPQIANPHQQQKKVTIQLGGKVPPPPQRISSKQIQPSLRKTHFEDQQVINGRRSAPLIQHQQDLQKNRQTMYNYKQQPQRTKSPIRPMMNNDSERVLSVSGKLRCSRCNDELGQGSAMVIESLGLYYHIECFRCFVCNIPLSSSLEGTDVRVRSNRLHCQNCFSDENGVKLSAV